MNALVAECADVVTLGDYSSKLNGSGSVRSIINFQRNFRFSSKLYQIMIYYTTYLISYFSLWPQNVQVGSVIIWIPGSEWNIYGSGTPVPRKKCCSLRYIIQVQSKSKRAKRLSLWLSNWICCVHQLMEAGGRGDVMWGGGMWRRGVRWGGGGYVGGGGNCAKCDCVASVICDIAV
jgi:hypothetical protein